MKKILLGTSALLVAGFVATAANAAPLKLSVGGYANWYTGYVDGNQTFDHPSAYNHTPVLGDVELAFTGETALDNGLKFGTVIEMTADDSTNTTPNATENVDQTYVYADSAYGRVVMGKMDGISRQFHTASKDVGLLGIQDSDVAMFLPVNTVANMSTDIRELDKVTGIHYISPKMNGFTVATSYVDGDEDATTNVGGNAAAYVGTVAYGNKLGAFDVGADASYAGYDSNLVAGELDYEVSTGARIGYEGFTFGAGYKYSEFETNSAADHDVDTFDVGVAYEKGPYGVSLSYIFATEEQTGTQDIDTDLLLLSGKYNVSAGVDTFVSFGYTTEEQTGTADVKAYVAATGLGLTF